MKQHIKKKIVKLTNDYDFANEHFLRNLIHQTPQKVPTTQFVGNKTRDPKLRYGPWAERNLILKFLSSSWTCENCRNRQEFGSF